MLLLNYDVNLLRFTAVVWNITVFLLTVFGVGSKKLPPGLPLRSALLVQGVAYASLTTLICIPMGVSPYLLYQLRQMDLTANTAGHGVSTIKW